MWYRGGLIDRLAGCLIGWLEDKNLMAYVAVQENSYVLEVQLIRMQMIHKFGAH